MLKMEAKTTVMTPEKSSIMCILHAMWQNRCLSLIVGLKIPELLCNAEKSSLSIEEIAQKTGCVSSKQLYNVMRVLAQWGFSKELKNKHFAKNQAIEELRRDKGPSLGHLIEYHCSEEHLSAMNSLAACVKQGDPAFVLEHGMNHFQYMNDLEKCPYDKAKMFQGSSKHLIGSQERRKEFAENYHSAMEVYTQLSDSQEFNSVYKVIPWSTCNKLVDMGGCSGYFLASILKMSGCQHIQGYVIDLPDVIEEARKNRQKLGAQEHRIKFIKHDFSAPFPSDIELQADTVVFKDVLSVFLDDEKKMIQILQNIRCLFPKHGGRVFIIDYCSPDAGDTEHNVGVNGIQLGYQSIHWLSICGGTLYTEAEWSERLQKIASSSRYQLEKIYDTFNGGSKIFQLSCHTHIANGH